ncbi:MAG: sulfite oxidase heme-binding subunit YedZ [Pseudomonadota bacterium]
MPGLLVTLVVLGLGGLAAFRIAAGDAGPDPAKWLLHQTGFWALVFLVATLAVSTLRRLLRRPTLALWRRPVGLAAFAIATSHLLVYLTVFHGLDVAAILDDVTKRLYIMIGFAAWLLLLPMAFTSTRTARRRLGDRWVAIHRAIYLIVPLGVLHQGMAQKADLGQTLVFSALVACFLIERRLAAKGLLPWARRGAKLS